MANVGSPRPAAGRGLPTAGRPPSVVADRLAVVAAAELVVRLVVDPVADEVDRPVGEDEVRPARVVRLEPPGDPPVPHAVDRIDPGATGLAAAPAPRSHLGDLPVQRDGRLAVGRATIGVGPAGGTP